MTRPRRDPYAELRRLLRRGRIDDEVSAELEHHFALLVARNLDRGMSADEARRAARDRFGDLDSIREETGRVDRQFQRRKALMESLSDAGRGVRHAIRRLARRPEFTLFAALTLTLAIGAFTALFTVLDRVVLSPLPYDRADELVRLESAVPYMGEGATWGLSQAGYFDFRDESRALASLGAYSTGGANLVSDAGPVRVRAANVTASLGPTLGLRPAVGRWFEAADDVPGAPSYVVLGHEFWRTQFGGDRGAIGATVDLGGSSHEVIGVLEGGLGLPGGPADVYLTMKLDPAAPPVNSHWLSAVGRLAPDATLEGARAELARLTATFTDKFPGAYDETFMRESGFATRVVPLKDDVLGGVGGTVWILFAAAGLLLVIAVANITNLYLVRIESRRHEFAVRTAMGAGRRHLVWQSLTETLLLALLAGALALGVARAGVGLLIANAPPNLPRLGEIALGPGAVWFTLGVSLLLGALLGLMPLAYQAFARTEDLRDAGTRTTPSRGRNRLRRFMLAGQMALALVLLAAGGLMLRSLERLRSTDPGFDAGDVLTLETFVPASRYGTYEEVSAFYRRFLERVEALPGVVSAGAATRLPMVRSSFCASMFVEDRPPETGRQPPCIEVATAAPGFFETLDVPVEGRTPTWSDVDATGAGVVVTRALAERLWPGESAIGKGIRGNGWARPFYRVVGVAEDFRSDGLDRPVLEGVFFPMRPIEGAGLWSPPNAMSIVVETNIDPASLVAPIRAALADLDPTVPIADARGLADAIGDSPSVSRASFTLLLLGIAAGLALLLSTIGMYGVVAQLVVERSGEIAVRLAVGADGAQVIRMLIGQSLRVAVAGAAVGLLVAALATRALRALLFEVAPGDPLTLGGATALLLAVVASATYLASRGAGRVDPIKTLRAE